LCLLAKGIDNPLKPCAPLISDIRGQSLYNSDISGTFFAPGFMKSREKIIAVFFDTAIQGYSEQRLYLCKLLKKFVSFEYPGSAAASASLELFAFSAITCKRLIVLLSPGRVCQAALKK
jgi:hypothetical protein